MVSYLLTVSFDKQLHVIFTADVTCMALCGILLFSQTDSNKFFSAGNDFLSCLAANFFTAYSQLSLDLIFAMVAAYQNFHSWRPAKLAA